MFNELFDMPIAYDMGINIMTKRSRKKHRKGVCRQPRKKEVILISSKEVADISGMILEKVLKGRF